MSFRINKIVLERSQNDGNEAKSGRVFMKLEAAKCFRFSQGVGSEATESRTSARVSHAGSMRPRRDRGKVREASLPGQQAALPAP